MNSDSPESDVRQFYADAKLPEDRVDAILSHGHSVAAARLWKRVAMASTLGLVGMILVCVVLFVRLLDDSRIAVVPADPLRDVTEESAEPANEAPNGITPAREGFQLIAVRSHGYRCPHCRASSEVIAELKESFTDERIEFTFIDLRRDAENLGESQQKFESLELNDLVEGRDKALIAIADPTGNLHKLDASAGADQLKRHISGLLGGE